MARRANPLIGVLIMPIFFIAGIFLAKYGGSVLDNAKASAEWPTVQGTVMHSDVVRERGTGDNRGKYHYEADVMFEFELDGQTYSSNNVSFGEYASSQASHAREIVRRYPEGSRVTVYYNPEDPDTAVLEPGVSWSSYILLGMGILFCAIGFFGFFGCLVAILR
jgi:hypothetical protein